jgi:hypothetical protein
MLVACLTLLGVGVRAAGSVSGERDKQTLDGLLTTPMTSEEMLWAKWLGSMTGLRWGFAWLLVIWGIAAGTGSLFPVLFGVLIVAWLVYAGGVAWIGLWYSLVSKTSLRATVWTVLTTLGVMIGHWLLLWCCCLPVQFLRPGSSTALEEFFKAIVRIQMGISPPVTLSFMLPWRSEELFAPRRQFMEEFGPAPMIGFALLGLAIWASAGVGLGILVGNRFRRFTGRGPRTPEGRPPRPVRNQT